MFCGGRSMGGTGFGRGFGAGFGGGGGSACATCGAGGGGGGCSTSGGGGGCSATGGTGGRALTGGVGDGANTTSTALLRSIFGGAGITPGSNSSRPIIAAWAVAETGRAALTCISEALGQPGEDRSPRAKLRRADTDPGAIADLIDLVEQINHVEPQLSPLPHPR